VPYRSKRPVKLIELSTEQVRLGSGPPQGLAQTGLLSIAKAFDKHSRPIGQRRVHRLLEVVFQRAANVSRVERLSLTKSLGIADLFIAAHGPPSGPAIVKTEKSSARIRESV